ncbi:MAG: NrfD/PsrC family molybdoenzyme membrane anchor subunit [Desulforhopalus sp.]
MILFSQASDPNTPTKNLIPLFIILSIATAIGFSFGLHAMIVGHDHVFGTTREVPWGILITPYVFFACLSTGICIISSLGQVFRIKTFAPIVNRSVFLAIITMATGLCSIGLEIENPWRMAIYGFLSPNPLSNIWWKSSIYTLYLLFMIFNFLFLLMSRPRIARGFAVGALVAVTCGNLNMNSDMALLGGRGFWAENYMPLFFLTISTLTACCAIVVVTWLSTWLHNREIDSETRGAMCAIGKLSVVLLIISISFSVMKILGGFSTKFTENPEAMHLLVKGDYAFNFWFGEIILAGVLPFLLLIISGIGRKITIFAIAGLSLMIGAFITFYDLIIVGQLIPHFHQYNLVDMPQFYSYSPSLHEYMMTLGAIGFFLTAFMLGEIVFNSVLPAKR